MRRICLLLLLVVATTAHAQDDRPRQTFLLQSQSDARLDLIDPGYFITGFDSNDEGQPKTNNNQIRFHLPVRYRMGDWNPTGWDTELYFAITQDSFWNIFDESAPFYETSFAPESYVYLWRWGWPVAAAIGAKHQSNGRDGELSRSWNRYYLSLTFGDPLKNAFYGQVSGWQAWGVSEDNEDIEDFVGRGLIDLYFIPGAITTPTRFGGDRLSVQLRAAVAGEKVIQNLEASVLFRIHKEAGIFSPCFYVQYFDGTGQILRDYQQHDSVWRVGLAIATHASARMR